MSYHVNLTKENHRQFLPYFSSKNVKIGVEFFKKVTFFGLTSVSVRKGIGSSFSEAVLQHDRTALVFRDIENTRLYLFITRWMPECITVTLIFREDQFIFYLKLGLLQF